MRATELAKREHELLHFDAESARVEACALCLAERLAASADKTEELARTMGGTAEWRLLGSADQKRELARRIARGELEVCGAREERLGLSFRYHPIEEGSR